MDDFSKKIVKQAIIATIFLLIGIGIVQYGVYSAIEQYENNLLLLAVTFIGPILACGFRNRTRKRESRVKKNPITLEPKKAPTICALCKDECKESCNCGTIVHSECVSEINKGLCPSCFSTKTCELKAYGDSKNEKPGCPDCGQEAHDYVCR